MSKVAALSALILATVAVSVNRDAFYLGRDMNTKFVRFELSTGPAWINVAHIVSIHKTNAVRHEGDTELNMINGESWFSEESVETFIDRLRETVEFER